MPSYRFKALTQAGEVRRGVLDAEDAAAVMAQLREQGLLPVDATPLRGGFLGTLLTLNLGGEPTIPAARLSAVTREIATMLGAGESLDRALRFVCETATHAPTRLILEGLREKVRGGEPLSKALTESPARFSRLYIGLVKAGEASGALAQTMERLADLLESERELNATIVSALIYPAILCCVAGGTIVMLVGYVLPQFEPIFKQNGAEVPEVTKFLIDSGQMLAAGLPYIAVILLAALLIGRRAIDDIRVRGRVDRVLLRVPILGGLLRELSAARFCRMLGTMLDNGSPLVASLDTVREALTNQAARDAVATATESVRSGGSLARSLAESAVFPPRAVHLMRLGEESGALARITLKAAAIHEGAVKIQVQRLVSLMVPVITVAMGMAVAGIIGSLLVALMGLNDLAG